MMDFASWRELGGLGAFLAGLLNTSILPIPGIAEALTLVLSAIHDSWWPFYAALTTAGSVVGGYLAYKAGLKGGKRTLEKMFGRKRMEQVYGKFDKAGFSAIFVAAILPPPIPISPFLLAAGALNYSMRDYLLALALGRSLRYGLVSLLGAMFGTRLVSLLSDFYEPVLYIAAGAAVLGIAIMAVLYIRHRRKK